MRESLAGAPEHVDGVRRLARDAPGDGRDGHAAAALLVEAGRAGAQAAHVQARQRAQRHQRHHRQQRNEARVVLGRQGEGTCAGAGRLSIDSITTLRPQPNLHTTLHPKSGLSHAGQQRKQARQHKQARHIG